MGRTLRWMDAFVLHRGYLINTRNGAECSHKSWDTYIYILYGYTGQSGLWVGNQCPHSILNIAHQQGIWYPTKTASGKLSKNAKVGSKMGMGRDGKSQNWRDGMLMFTKVIKAPTPGLSVEESDHFRPLVARHLKYPSVKGQWRLYKHE